MKSFSKYRKLAKENREMKTIKFKDFTIGKKIFTALAIILVSLIVVEGVVFVNLRQVSKSSNDIADIYIESTEAIQFVAQDVNDIMFNIRGYGLSGNGDYLALGQESFKTVQTNLDNAIVYADMTDKIDSEKLKTAKTIVTEYEALVNDTVAVNEEIDNVLVRMTEAAGKYFEEANSYLTSQNDKMVDAINSGNDDAINQRVKKISVVNDIIALGYNIRVNNTKFMLLGDESLLDAVGENFGQAEENLNLLVSISSDRVNLNQIESIRSAAAEYSMEIENYRAQNKILANLATQREVKGNDLLAATGEVSDINFAAMTEGADDNLGYVAKTMAILIGGLIIFMIVALAFFIPITKGITNSIHRIIYMIKEMRLGHYSERLEINSKDEIGQMSEELNEYFEGTQKYLLTNLDKLAKGDMDIDIHIADEKDERGPAIKKTRDSINDLLHETQTLIQASIEGKLDTRGNTRNFEGGYKGIVQGVNAILDAVILPIQEASDVLQEMEKGNLNVQVKGDYKGDHAKIKNALNDTINIIRGYVEEITSVLGEMAGGNMNQSVDGEYRGDFSAIKVALNTIIESLNEVLGEMNNSAEQVASGSKQVSDGSQELSQGSTEQASSVEELTASITEIAAQTNQNAANANEANRLTNEVKTNASDGNKQMSEMLDSMKEINEASGNISKIIKVIDEIAFQTNLLALNAAVEAARAGQHGKGFAVVAEEVRNLAARSANAAKETTAMIEGSIDKVEAGTRIANDTAKALEDIVKGVDKAANLVAEISGASNEQATAVAQINEGLEQVSKVVQSNSATAEESAAASEELSSQSELLKDMVNKFNLKGSFSSSFAKAPKTNYKSNLDKVYREAEDIVINLDDREFGKY